MKYVKFLCLIHLQKTSNKLVGAIPSKCLHYVFLGGVYKLCIFEKQNKIVLLFLTQDTTQKILFQHTVDAMCKTVMLKLISHSAPIV